MSRKTGLLLSFLALSFAAPLAAKPETLTIDKGHTFITFKVSHIGFAWIPGAFTDFSGELAYDAENPAASTVKFTVQVPSLDTFHAERDKHLKSGDFFDAGKHATATFVSTAYEPAGENQAILRGNLTIKGITKPVEFKVNELAAKEDPWGNFRRAWEAETELDLGAFKLNDALGGSPKTATVKIALEAVRAK